MRWDGLVRPCFLPLTEFSGFHDVSTGQIMGKQIVTAPVGSHLD